MQELAIDVAGRSYPILIGDKLLDDAAVLERCVAARDVLVVTDETVAPLYLERVLRGLAGRRTASIALPAGEQHKTLAGVAPLFQLGNQPQLTLISAVLLLVPGVPLINSVQDLMKGYPITGIARGVTGGVIAACIALGLLLAVSLLGVNGL